MVKVKKIAIGILLILAVMFVVACGDDTGTTGSVGNDNRVSGEPNNNSNAVDSGGGDSFEFVTYNDTARGIKYDIVKGAIELETNPLTPDFKQFVWEDDSIGSQITYSISSNPNYDEEDRLYLATMIATNFSDDWSVIYEISSPIETLVVGTDPDKTQIIYRSSMIYNGYEITLTCVYPANEEIFDKYFDVVEVLRASLFG